MKIVIIEDEPIVADDLEKNFRMLLPQPLEIDKIASVMEGIEYFSKGLLPDLIFSDIQLGDGLSFEIFIACKLSVPVIFCTAYDEYALDAFKANGIDYVLKPFSKTTLSSALQKYHRLKQLFSAEQTPQMAALVRLMSNSVLQRASSILVYHQDKIIPVNVDEIALFYLANEILHLLTFSGKTYYPNGSLDEMERVSGNSFFRANRQFLVSRRAINDVSSFFTRKLSVNLKMHFEERIYVSKVKAPIFLKWLSNE